MENLIIFGDESRISTSPIAKGFGRKHDQLIRLIRKYESDFKELGSIMPSPKIYGRGRPVEGILLNEGQTMFLSCLLKTSKATIKFKKILSQAFGDNSVILKKIKIALKNFDFDDVGCRYVYAAQDQDGNLKIGISNNPKRRIKELNTGNVQTLKLVYIKEAQNPRYQDEAAIHRAAAPHKIRGEWFTEEAQEALIG